MLCIYLYDEDLKLQLGPLPRGLCLWSVTALGELWDAIQTLAKLYVRDHFNPRGARFLFLEIQI